MNTLFLTFAFLHRVSSNILAYALQDGYRVFHMDLQEDGRSLAVSGYSNKWDSFVALCTLNSEPDSQEIKPPLTISQPWYTKEFTRVGRSWRRCVCLNKLLFITCLENTIESYDTKYGGLVTRKQINGQARCLALKNKCIFVGLYEPKVIVFDLSLKQIKTIILRGFRDDEWLWDITVNENSDLFICTVKQARALMLNSEGGVEQEYNKPNQSYKIPWSLTISEKNSLTFILWGAFGGNRVVVVYSCAEGYSLVSCKVPRSSVRIRINVNVDRLFVVTENTGDVYEYHTVSKIICSGKYGYGSKIL